MPRIDPPACHADSDGLPVLAGVRATLRGLREDDAEALFALHSDPRAMRYWSFVPWTDRSQVHDYLARGIAARDPERMLCWAIAHAGDDALVGTATLFAINREQGRAEIGATASCAKACCASAGMSAARPATAWCMACWHRSGKGTAHPPPRRRAVPPCRSGFSRDAFPPRSRRSPVGTT